MKFIKRLQIAVSILKDGKIWETKEREAATAKSELATAKSELSRFEYEYIAAAKAFQKTIDSLQKEFPQAILTSQDQQVVLRIPVLRETDPVRDMATFSERKYELQKAQFMYAACEDTNSAILEQAIEYAKFMLKEGIIDVYVRKRPGNRPGDGVREWVTTMHYYKA